jgi:hypothetical protein
MLNDPFSTLNESRSTLRDPYSTLHGSYGTLNDLLSLLRMMFSTLIAASSPLFFGPAAVADGNRPRR